jgi:acetylornithine/N-succinyldiaminopimelate aminotransferase
MNNWMEIEKQYYMFCARRQPITIVRGSGSRVWDDAEKEYLDFTAGWACDSLGHCHPAVVEAITKQAGTLLQTSNQFYTLPQLDLAKLLVENSCLDKVFFCNSGAEANEGAIKLARKYGKENLEGAFEIITANNSFHGRTMTTVSATGNINYQVNFLPLTPGFIHVPFNSIDAIKENTNKNTCAVMLEPIQGEGGVNVPDLNYLREVRSWCDENNILLILDEVQTGMGRLGKLFGYELYGIEPDVITLAKGMGGGVPIGAFLTKEHCNVLRPGDHGSTFGGNPLTCAAAFACCNYIVQNDLPAYVNQIGAVLKTGLEDIASRHESFITEIRGEGLLLAVELSKEASGDLVAACNNQGLLLNSVRPNAVRFMPPLNVSEDDVALGLVRFENAINSL